MAMFAYSIIPNAAQQIVLRRSATGWTLPEWTWAERHFWQDCAHINQRIASELDLAVTTLRCIAWVDAESSERANLYYAHELHSAPLLPVAYEWVAFAQLEQYQLSPEQQRIITQWHAHDSENPAAYAVPWYSPGWSESATRWMIDQLRSHGIVPTAPPQQRRTWGRSTLWRIQSTSGTVYFKAVPAMFAHEIALPTHYFGRMLLP